MSGLRIVLGLVVGCALATGCDKKEPVKPAVPKPPTPDVTPNAGASMGAATPAPSSVATSGGTVTPTTAPAITKTPVASSPTTAPTSPKAAAGGEAGDTAIAPVKPTPSGDQVKQAQDLISKAIASLKDNKPDEARASIEKVEAMNEALPKTIYEQLKTVRANLDSIDKARKTELPTLGDEVNK